MNKGDGIYILVFGLQASETCRPSCLRIFISGASYNPPRLIVIYIHITENSTWLSLERFIFAALICRQLQAVFAKIYIYIDVDILF